MKILVTGSRNYAKQALVDHVLDVAVATLQTAIAPGDEVGVIHGGATGADQHTRVYAESRGLTQTIVLPDWDGRGKSAGPERNQKMVDLRPAVCVAFPLAGSRGTWDCVRRARAAGIPTWVIRDFKWSAVMPSLVDDLVKHLREPAERAAKMRAAQAYFLGLANGGNDAG